MRKLKVKSQESRVFGFTLIELIVGAGLFVTAVVGLSALFVGILRIQRQAFLESLVIDNTRYAMEEMARAIRVADIERKVRNLPPAAPYQDLVLDNQPMLGGSFGCDKLSGCELTYQRQGAILEERRWDPDTGQLSEFDLAGGQNVEINRFHIVVAGCEDEENEGLGAPVQPRVSIALEARPLGITSSQPLNLATTVSLRTVRNTCD